MDYPRFTTEQAATVAGVSVNTLSTWLKRGLISSYPSGSDVPPDTIAPGTGRGRLFTRRSMRHIAMVARLSRAGISIEQASMCAMKFLDTGDFDGDRLPGQFYNSLVGTALVVRFQQSAVPSISIMTRQEVARNVDAGMIKDDVLLVLDLEAFMDSVDDAIKHF